MGGACGLLFGQDVVLDEAVEAVLESAARDPECTLKPVESSDAGERGLQDQQGPPVAEDDERSGDRTRKVGKLFVSHDSILPMVSK